MPVFNVYRRHDDGSAEWKMQLIARDSPRAVTTARKAFEISEETPMFAREHGAPDPDYPFSKNPSPARAGVSSLAADHGVARCPE